MRKFILPVVVALMMVAAVMTGQSSRAAADVYSLNITEVQFVQCGGSVIEGRIRVVATNTSGAVLNNSTPINGVEYYDSPNGSTTPQNASYLAGELRGFYISIPPAPLDYLDIYVASVDNPIVRSDTYRVYCNQTINNLGGAVTATGGTTGGGVDDRLNMGQGDLLNVLYARYDRNSKPEIHVYSLNSLSQGVFQGTFPYVRFLPYLTKPPQRNVLIAKVGSSSLYALASGEFQINVGPDSEGKIYSVFFTGLPPKNIYYGR